MGRRVQRGEESLLEGGVSRWIVFHEEDFDPWSPEELAWRRRAFYARRAWAVRRRAWREALRRRAQVFLAPGSVLTPPGHDTVPSLCEVFRMSCAGQSSARASEPTPGADRDATATLRRPGRSWQLTNGLVEVTIDPDALCRMSLRRWTEDEPVPPFTFATPSPADCVVIETAPPDPDVTHGAVALALTWRGDGWWQQVVVALRDGAHAPEASVTRVQREGHARRVALGNLSGDPLTWTLPGRDVTVAPRDALQLTL